MEAISLSAVACRHFPLPLASSTTQTVPGSLSNLNGARKPVLFSSFCAPISTLSIGSASNDSFARVIWGWVHARNWSIRRGGLRIRAEMFGQLTSSLEAAWSKLRREDVITKENIVEPMRDIRRALLEADVSLPVVRRFVQAVTEQAVGVGLIRGVRPDQQLVKIVNDELVKLMGGEVSELEFAKSGPTVFLLAGLQGVGKTTVCAKLAFYLKKQEKSCMLVAADVYRPAAIDQLKILGEQVVKETKIDGCS